MKSALLARLAKTNWEKSATVLKEADSALLAIDADYIFELLLHYCDQCRETGELIGLKFYVDGVRLEPFEAMEHLPIAGDKSLTGYHKRMRRMFKDYGLVCDELLQSMKSTDVRDGEAWRLVSDFGGQLFQRTGLPNRFAEIGLYLGNYRQTPFGVHVDRCGVLSIPVVGNKTFRLWDPAYVAKNPELKEAFSYDEFKSKSQVLTVKPGELAYWPSSHWHIAESDGSFSATWSIGFWADRPLTDVTREVLSPLIESKVTRALGKRAQVTTLPVPNVDESGFIKALPKDLVGAATAIARLSKSDVHDALLVWWLAQTSKRGFRESRSRTDAKLSIGDTVSVNPDQPILWTELSTKEIAWAVNGVVAHQRYSQEIVQLIKVLNLGRPITVSKKISLAGLGMLQAMLTHGAVKKCPSTFLHAARGRKSTGT